MSARPKKAENDAHRYLPEHLAAKTLHMRITVSRDEDRLSYGECSRMAIRRVKEGLIRQLIERNANCISEFFNSSSGNKEYTASLLVVSPHEIISIAERAILSGEREGYSMGVKDGKILERKRLRNKIKSKKRKL